MAITSFLEALKKASTRSDVAKILEVKPSVMAYILYIKPASQRYKTFQIAKKSGGFREINAPADDLKTLQSNLAEVLTNCVKEISFANEFHNHVAHGFMPDRSIFTNAYSHRKKRYVFNIDLQDFFGTITFPRLRGFFIKDQDFALKKDVATVLAQIACHNSRLPQGSPCSPIISNLIGQILDMHLLRLAIQNGCTYTRYADDLTFSTNKRKFPPAIAEEKAQSESNHKWIIGRQLQGLIKKCDFVVNDTKTRMQYRTSRQEVTGLVTNTKVNVRTEYRHDVRAKVHRLLMEGQYFNKTHPINAEGKKTIEQVPGTLNELHGRLGFIHTMDKFNRTQVVKHTYNYPGVKLERKTTGNESMYLRFLLYKLLYANTVPLLICEGKTDNVYLSKAIHQLHKKFPELIKISATNKRVLSVQLFKYAETSTGQILGNESGGAPGLSKLMRTYFDEIKRFKAPQGPHPVIFIVDNDTGATAKGNIYGTVRNLVGINPTGSEAFINVFSNVYVVATPLNGQKSSCIEDLFSAKDKGILIEGKSFDPSSKADTRTHYSKATFAYKVVEKKDDIDFTMFEPFLQNIVNAIAHHHSKP